VLYARALEHGFHVDFDLVDQRPHAPGYILYVATAALVRTATGDSNAALVLVSMVAGAAAAAALYLFAQRFASRGAALAAAAAFAASPLVWTYGEVAYPYTVLALGSIVLAALLHRARHGTTHDAVAATAALGLAAGFRQDLVLVVGALWLWALAAHPWRVRVVASAAGLVAALAWLVPTAALSEGAEAYLFALTQQASTITAAYSPQSAGVPALATNLGTTVYALAWTLCAAAVPLAIGLGLCARSSAAPPIRSLALWALPPLAFYLLVHIGEWGYVLSVAPALYIGVAMALDRIAGALPHPRVATGALGGATVLAGAVVFAISPAPFSAAATRAHDDELAARVAYVRGQLDPRHVAVLAREDYLVVRYYLPEYRSLFHDPFPFANAPRHKRVGSMAALVVFTKGLAPAKGTEVRYIECAKGVKLAYVPLPPGAMLEFYGEQFAIREPQ
jgi:4-amino-4-deoxy-L-arabinose transferase-like glycosyltransferase